MLKEIIESNAKIKPNSVFINELQKHFPQFFIPRHCGLDPQSPSLIQQDQPLHPSAPFKGGTQSRHNGLDPQSPSLGEHTGSPLQFDIEKFRNELAENNISEARDGYRLSFVGKDYARLQSEYASETLITPDIEHNSKPENANSQNIFITGDNLEALRHLQNAYRNKVKMIYIDPPYNTGKEFVYNDYFEYTDQKLYKNQTLADEYKVAVLPELQIEPGLKYYVYLDVWEREVDGTEDDRIINKAIGIETCLRIKLEWVVRVAGKGMKTEEKPGHGYYTLAEFTAPETGVTLPDSHVLSLRRTDLAVLSRKSVENKHLAENAVTTDKIAPGAVAFNNIFFGKKEWPPLKLTEEEEDDSCFVEFNTSLQLLPEGETIADKMKPVFWAVYPLEGNLLIYNSYGNPQTPTADAVTWYTRVGHYVEREDEGGYVPRFRSFFRNRLFIYNGYSEKKEVKVMCWWFK